MTIKEYIQMIQKEINNDRPYEEYACRFKEYKNYLESVIEKTPGNITAVCQLAAVLMELRHSYDDSIKIMEDALSRFESQLTSDEKLRLHTNLAFFYQENGEKDKEIAFLRKAVNSKSGIPNAYDALAICLMAKNRTTNVANEIHEALPLFEQAAKLSDEFRYQHNYAVSLYWTGNIASAKTIFGKLHHQNDSNRQAIYGLGVCSYYLGNTKIALDMATRLATIGADDEIDDSQIAELFYLCGDYENHNAMFDRCKIPYYYDATWLAPYFYSSKSLNNYSLLMKKYSEAVESRKSDIEEAKREELDDSYTAKDRNEYVAELQKELADIEHAYHTITHENYKPEVSPKLDFIYGCYLVDCPRHQSEIWIDH